MNGQRGSQGKGKEGGHSNSLCSFVITGRKLPPLHKSQPSRLAAQCLLSWHPANSQSNYSNATSFWLISAFVLWLFHPLTPFLFFRRPIRWGASMGKHLFIAALIWHQAKGRALLFPMPNGGMCPVCTPFKWKGQINVKSSSSLEKSQAI